MVVTLARAESVCSGTGVCVHPASTRLHSEPQVALLQTKCSQSITTISCAPEAYRLTFYTNPGSIFSVPIQTVLEAVNPLNRLMRGRWARREPPAPSARLAPRWQGLFSGARISESPYQFKLVRTVHEFCLLGCTLNSWVACHQLHQLTDARGGMPRVQVAKHPHETYRFAGGEQPLAQGAAV